MMKNMGFLGYVSGSSLSHTESKSVVKFYLYCSPSPQRNRPANVINPKGTYFLFGSFCASMFFFAYFLIPETKGMSLEKMDELFGITDMLRVMNDMERRRPYSYRETQEYEMTAEKKWARLSG
jgi:hypothetical protein